jgi:hypothetical protein
MMLRYLRSGGGQPKKRVWHGKTSSPAARRGRGGKWVVADFVGARAVMLGPRQGAPPAPAREIPVRKGDADCDDGMTARTHLITDHPDRRVEVFKRDESQLSHHALRNSRTTSFASPSEPIDAVIPLRAIPRIMERPASRRLYRVAMSTTTCWMRPPNSDIERLILASSEGFRLRHLRLHADTYRDPGTRRCRLRPQSVETHDGRPHAGTLTRQQR